MTKEFGVKREMSVQAALEWAFGTEHAQLEFDDLAQDGARVGVSPIWVMMQRGALGCQIDGGGKSRVADDAEMIAAALADLPVALGGRAMAVEMAALARAGAAPTWDIDMTPRCVPRQWDAENQHGQFAKTVIVEHIEVVGKRGARGKFEVRACPVTYVPSASQIAMVKRRYQGWVLALRHLHMVLNAGGYLSHITLTDAMPASAPWMAAVKKDHKTDRMIRPIVQQSMQVLVATDDGFVEGGA